MTTEATPPSPGPEDVLEGMSVNERDQIALSDLAVANEFIGHALKAMPSSISSVFDPDDAKRLHIAQRDLALLLMAGASR